jgi:hypothetical protein
MARFIRWGRDGDELYRWYVEDGRYWRVHTSINEDKIMDQNKRIQADGGARTLSIGRAVFRMSKAQKRWLEKKYPALKSPDPQEMIKGWEWIARNPDYRGIVIGKP